MMRGAGGEYPADEPYGSVVSVSGPSDDTGAPMDEPNTKYGY